MSETRELQIHTVFSAEQEQTLPAASPRLRVLAVLTLVVGLCWLYVTWRPVWKWIEHELMVGELMLTTMGSQPRGVLPGATKPESHARPKAESNAQKRKATQNAQQRLGGISAGWLGLTTLMGLWLTMAGTAGLAGGRRARRLGWLLAPIVLALGVWMIYHVQVEYAWLESILPRWVRPALVVLGVALAVAVGCILERRRVGLLRLSGMLVVLSACATLVALWAALRWGGLPSEGLDRTLYVKAFALQSAYGWVLLLSTIRLRA